MPASINDRITQATNGTRPTPTTLTALLPSGASPGTATCGALTGWPTATAVHFIIYTIDTNGNKVAGSQTDWKGVVSGSTITALALKAGTNNGYSIGAIVECSPTAAWANDITLGVNQDHDSQGRHTQLTDSNGNLIVSLNAVGSAVNRIQITNAAAGGGPRLTAVGTDTDISVTGEGKGAGRFLADGLPPQTFVDEGTFDFTTPGTAVITADSVGVNRNASITQWNGYINGVRGGVAASTARTYTASKDTYVDVNVTAGTFAYVFTEVVNNAASPALAASSIRIAIIVTGVSNIAAATSINQGQTDRVLPIASSIAYTVTDSLGNLIYNTTPNPVQLGYRQSVASFNYTSLADVTGLSVPIIVPTGRRVRISAQIGSQCDTASSNQTVQIMEGATILATTKFPTPVANVLDSSTPSITVTPTAGLHTYKVQISTSVGNSATQSSSTIPCFISVDLV